MYTKGVNYLVKKITWLHDLMKINSNSLQIENVHLEISIERCTGAYHGDRTSDRKLVCGGLCQLDGPE